MHESFHVPSIRCISAPQHSASLRICFMNAGKHQCTIVLSLTACLTAAFDKNDALFMRDEAEKARHRELEQRDAELARFSRLRSQLDQAAALEVYDPGPAPKRTKIVKYADLLCHCVWYPTWFLGESWTVACTS
jgi:hypothetical protein